MIEQLTAFLTSPSFYLPFAAFALAGALTLLLGPTAARLAISVGLVDSPDNHRKLHKKAIPLVGGLLIFPICLSVVLLIGYFGNFYQLTSYSPNDWWQIGGLGIATCLMLVIGLLDDRFALRGRQKVIGQLVAITILIAFGYQFSEVAFLGFQFQFGVFSVLIVYAWMMGATNSINLLDGADGFAATIGIILCAAFAIMSAINGNYIDAVVAASLSGTLFGFLKFNFPPAKVFLGDSGSMLIGFILGALAIRLTYKQATVYTFLGPIAILAIPFLDTSAAIIRRRLTGRSIYTTDRGHLHHELQRKGISSRRILFYVAILCSVTSAGGVLSLVTKESEYALISIAAVIVFLLVSRLFGFAEFRLLSGKVVSISKSFLVVSRPKKIQNSEVRIQGEGNWQEVWNELRNFAAAFQVSRLTLDLNIPWLHESFHATLKQETENENQENSWWSEIPVVVDDRIIGRIDLLSTHTPEFPVYTVIDSLLLKIAQLQDTIRQTLKSCEATPQKEQSGPDIIEGPKSKSDASNSIDWEKSEDVDSAVSSHDLTIDESSDSKDDSESAPQATRK